MRRRVIAMIACTLVGCPRELPPPLPPEATMVADRQQESLETIRDAYRVAAVERITVDNVRRVLDELEQEIEADLR